MSSPPASHIAIAITAKGVVDEVDLPTGKPGPDEVLIRVSYGAMIPFDSYQVDRGTFVQGYPHVLGFSVSGTVVELGRGIDNLEVGDKVAAMTFQDPKNKALQEYVILSRYVVGKLPDTFPLAEAASIPDNFVCAYWTLFGPNLKLPVPTGFGKLVPGGIQPAIHNTESNVTPVSHAGSAPSAGVGFSAKLSLNLGGGPSAGAWQPDHSPPTPPAGSNEPILVYGASSSAGQYIVQLLQLAGYSNIIATGSPRNHDYLTSLGVKHAIDYKSATIVEDILQKAGKKLEIVIDIIAVTASLDIVSKVIAPGGKLALLIPIKEGDNVTNPVDKEMILGIPDSVKSKFQDSEIIPVATFSFLSDDWIKENLMPRVFPQLLQAGLLKPNPIRLLHEGSFKDRVMTGLDLLRNNKVSGEKVVVEIKHKSEN